MKGWTQKRLERLGREWQKRLALQDWVIRYEIVKADVLRGNLAECERHTVNKRWATIRVAPPESFGVTIIEPDKGDVEISLVHELLHLHLWPMRDAVLRLYDSKNSLLAPLVDMAHAECMEAEERAVFHLSRALVALKRAKEG